MLTHILPCCHHVFLENNHLYQGESRSPARAGAHLPGRSQAVLLFLQLLTGSIQALLAQPVALQLLPHLLFCCGLTLLELSNACQELLVAIHLALWRRKSLVRECSAQRSQAGLSVTKDRGMSRHETRIPGLLMQQHGDSHSEGIGMDRTTHLSHSLLTATLLARKDKAWKIYNSDLTLE